MFTSRKHFPWRVDKALPLAMGLTQAGQAPSCWLLLPPLGSVDGIYRLRNRVTIFLIFTYYLIHYM